MDKFRKAYVAQNTQHDFSDLRDISDEIVFVTTGYEDEGNLHTTVEKSLVDFDPNRDVIVPVGNVFVNLLVGQVLGRKDKYGSYRVALFRGKEYHVRTVILATLLEALNDQQ